jgi:two-component system sensor histidine kinase PilS (NtrC family)
MSFFSANPDFKNLTQHSELILQVRAISIINIFRFILSLIFIFSYLYVGEVNWLDIQNARLFFNLALAYLVFSTLLLILSQLKPAILLRILPLQIIIDIIFIVLLMHSAGGTQSGLGLLLIITIVTAGLVSNGRLALFYASIASISLLLEQSYQMIRLDVSPSTYTQPVMLSLSCFATAWLAHSLAKRMHHSEALASSRGIDLENLAQVNALITQEMHDGVIVVDEHFNIRHHNLQAESLLALAKNNADFIMRNHAPDDNALSHHSPEIALMLNRWLKDEDANNNAIISINHREIRLRFMPINQLSHLHKANADINVHADHFLGAVIFIQDWSQLQSAAQQAKLAALGRLTANIAHEIRNPLSAISHANQLLQEEDNISAPTTRILQIVADNIQRIDQIINDVLELNRRDRTQQERIALNPFLVDFYAQFCAVEKIPAANFQLECHLQEPFVYFDKRHLTQILWNLCKNGWQHSQKHTASLCLRCSERGSNGINIEVTDDGSGVNEPNKSKLFEPFFTTQATGSGLGLYISRELAEANGASLQYQALNVGSAFVIHLKKSI